MSEIVLSGQGWRFCPDLFDEGEAHKWHGESFNAHEWHGESFNANEWHQVAVPVVFDRCHPDLTGYEGIGWFRRVFQLPKDFPTQNVVLHFEAVNYRAKVWLNGAFIGENQDGFLPFDLPVSLDTLHAGGANVLAVCVDNTRRAGDIPGLERGWRPFGGILRFVSLRVASFPPAVPSRSCPVIAVQEGAVTIDCVPTLFLGFNRHEDSVTHDMTADYETAKNDLIRIKETGANFVRLCHYPHDPRTLDLCDELGLYVMCEIPLYWWRGARDGQEVQTQTLATAKRQLARLIARDKHHPCIVAWCVSNETDEFRPEVAQGNAELVRFVKALDPSRLAVHVSNQWTNHPHFEADDVICINAYPYMGGRKWGGGTPLTAVEAAQHLAREIGKLHDLYPDKPIWVTEFGHPALHGVKDGDASETRQAEIVREQLRAILSAGPYVCGATVWCWADHAWAEDDWLNFLHTSPFGVVTRDRREKAARSALETEFRRAGSAPSLFMRRANLDNLPAIELPDGYALRAATIDDAQGVAHVLQAAFSEMTWDTDKAERELLGDATVKTVWVIEREGQIVATASSRLLPDAFGTAGYVHWVGSDPAHRGKRLGYLVSLAVLHDFVRLGCDGAVLETDDFRLPAIRVYENLQFVPQYRHATHAPRWAKVKQERPK